jgi:hypothetical protein
MLKFLLVGILAVAAAFSLHTIGWIDGSLAAWMAAAAVSAVVWLAIVSARPKLFGAPTQLVGLLVFGAVAWLLATQNWWNDGHDIAAALAIGALAALVVAGVPALSGGRTATQGGH